MNKLRIGVIFGGMSPEHYISIASGTAVMINLNKEKYEIYPIYIDEAGNWYEYKDQIKQYQIGDDLAQIEKIENIIEYIKKLDVAFPVLHGLYGEDGSIQGMFELFNIPYVGCKILGSSLGMDKVYSKIMFEKAGIKQAKYEYIKKFNDKYIYVDKKLNETIYNNIEEICKFLEKKLTFPMFIKPSNSGSSVGINQAHNLKELKEYIKIAEEFDNKILIEERVMGREIECSVLGNEIVKTSCVGEIITDEEFYTYNSKYNNSKTKLIIPADLTKKLTEEIQQIAIKAFKAIDGKGFSRVDFLVNDKTGEINIIEINTIPGFTNISMFPKLFEKSGTSYSDLLEQLINLTLELKK